MTQILLVSSDPQFKSSIAATLKYHGFEVTIATGTTEGWKHLREIRFNFILVDYQLKNESGLAFFKALRHFGTSTPVILIGECAFDEFMLKDFSTANYDYVLKPVELSVLKEKMHRLTQVCIAPQSLICIGGFEIDAYQHLVRMKDQFVQLGKIEMMIMLLLIRKVGEVIDPKKICSLLRAEGSFDHNMNTFYYVSKLRKKLKKIAGEAFDISLIKHQGYKFELKA